MPYLDIFGQIAARYDRLLPFRDGTRLRRLLGLPIAGRLLDIGGGTGRVSAAFAAETGLTVVLDESPEMLRQAVAKGLPAVCASAERLPFADGVFQRALMVDSLHHMADAQTSLAEACRVLCVGGAGHDAGRLVIEEPNIAHNRVRLIALGERLLGMRSRFYRAAHLRDMLRVCGARILQEEEGADVWLVATHG